MTTEKITNLASEPQSYRLRLSEPALRFVFSQSRGWCLLESYSDDEFMLGRPSDGVVPLKHLPTDQNIYVPIGDVGAVQLDAGRNPNGLKYGTIELRNRVWISSTSGGLMPQGSTVRPPKVTERPVW
jgi:hypothetical protein